jgi:ABC-2 type transport system ATP-binding protein
MSIIVKNISKIYGEQRALDSVSFEIKTGDIVGFLGPNGAGKSTMMKILTGFIPANEGEAFVNNYNVSLEPLKVKQSIGYLPEHNPLYLDMYVKEFLRFTAGLFKIKNRKQAVEEVISLTGLSREQHKKIGALSKGYRQRVGLAQAIIHKPKVLILDEPTTGLDPNQIVEIRNLILELGKEKTIMLSTHIMQEVEALCQKVIIIDKGKIVAQDSVNQIQRNINENHLTIQIEFGKQIELEKLLAIENVSDAKALSPSIWLIQSHSDIREELFNLAVKNSNSVLSMQKIEKRLEDVFRELTK